MSTKQELELLNSALTSMARSVKRIAKKNNVDLVYGQEGKIISTKADKIVAKK